jgi:hypothetical protein
MNPVLASLIAACGLVGEARELPTWQASYGQALEQSKSERRPLLVVISDSSVPGSQADHLVSDDGPGAGLLRNYQLCHVDAATAYGRKVAAAFAVDQLPFVVITDNTGSVQLYRRGGLIGAAEWSETLAAYRSGERRTLQPAGRRGVICFT